MKREGGFTLDRGRTVPSVTWELKSVGKIRLWIQDDRWRGYRRTI